MILVLVLLWQFEDWRNDLYQLTNRHIIDTEALPLGLFEDYGDVVKRIIAEEGVLGASPYLDGEGMIRSAAGGILGVRVRGIDPELIGEVTDLREDLLVCEMRDFRGTARTVGRAAPATFAYGGVDHRDPVAFVELDRRIGTESDAYLAADADIRIDARDQRWRRVGDHENTWCAGCDFPLAGQIVRVGDPDVVVACRHRRRFLVD